MENSLVTELSSLSVAALTATSAAERSDWHVAARCASDLRIVPSVCSPTSPVLKVN